MGIGPNAAAPVFELVQLKDDELEIIGYEMCDVLDPGIACALAACCHNHQRVMQVPLTKLQQQHAAARALATKVKSSCTALRETPVLNLAFKNLNANDMTTLAMIITTGALPRVTHLSLVGNCGMSELFDGLHHGDAPLLVDLNLGLTHLGVQGATAFAAALARGALPALEIVYAGANGLGNEGLETLAEPMRQRHNLSSLILSMDSIIDAGHAALSDRLRAADSEGTETIYKAFEGLKTLLLF